MGKTSAFSEALERVVAAIKSNPKDAEKILNVVDKPEIATQLTGDARQAYLDALNKVQGTNRAKEMGFGNRDWYHGSTVDIPEFDKGSLGLSTNAQSAKKGFFFASDPSTASDYAELAREKGVNPESVKLARSQGSLNSFQDEMRKKYGTQKLSFESGNPPIEGWQDKMNADELSKWYSLRKQAKEAEAADTSRFLRENEKMSYNDVDAARSAWLDSKNRDYYNEDAKKRLIDFNRFANDPKNADQLAKRASIYNGGLDVKEYIKQRSADIESGIKPKESLEEVAALKKKYENTYAKYVALNPDLSSKTHSIYLDAAKNHPEETDLLNKANLVGQDVSNSYGQQVGSYRLKGQPDTIHVKDYKGQGYRDSTYADEMKEAQDQGKEGILFKRTYDPADPGNRVKQDIAAVFEPNQIRSTNAAFDKRFADSPLVLAGAAAIPKEDMSPISYLQKATGLWNSAKEKIAEPLANQLDFTKDKSAKEGIKEVLSTVADPLNFVPGAAGVGLSALQLMGSGGKKDSENEAIKRKLLDLRNVGT